MDRNHYIAEVVFDQHRIGSLDCNVAPTADRHAKVRAGKGWCVVDAIANHRDGTAPIALERSDLISFLTWQHLREGSKVQVLMTVSYRTL
eukprot:COSAG01_NODE_16271_length_1253_cov_0.782496_2_plen_90_part_00